MPLPDVAFIVPDRPPLRLPSVISPFPPTAAIPYRLLLFSVANRSLGDVLTSESVAIEIARSAVGGVALALSVPLTTAIAAVLATPAVNS